MTAVGGDTLAGLVMEERERLRAAAVPASVHNRHTTDQEMM
jgi:hypothetical protein